MEQTIGFHKLEDNVTSTRLEKLSKFRRDHASQAMHELSRNNVIIHRHGGQYRNYVSINFNLESWGAGQKNSHARSNDPRLLISDAYEGQAVDQGLDLSVVNEPEAGLETHMETDQSNGLTAHSEPSANLPEEPIDQGYDLAKMSETKTRSPQSEKVIDEDKLTLKIQNAVTSALNSIEKKVTSQLQSFAKQLHTVEEKFQTVKIEPNASVSNFQTPLNNTETTGYATASPAVEYQFPIQLSTQQCQELERSLLPRAGDYSQALLNTLGKRLQNSTDPLKNPMAYISSLVSKLEAGTLDLQSFFSNTELAAKANAAQPQTRPVLSAEEEIAQQKSEKYEQLQQQIDQFTQRYLAEYAIYKPFQKQIEQAIKETDLSYWEVTDKLELTATVTPILNKLGSLQDDVKRLEAEQEVLTKTH
jgi:hypothetical protein